MSQISESPRLHLNCHIISASSLRLCLSSAAVLKMCTTFAPSLLSASLFHRPRTSSIPCCTTVPSPPVRSGRVSHALVLQQAASAILSSDSRLLTIDFPPERSESRSGTLVARYENNLNFAEKLFTVLGLSSPVPIGGTVLIRDNVNPQGGGEYLDDDEVLTGLRGDDFSVLINAGVDSAALRQVSEIDNGGRIVLLNCALDRLSWFARRSVGGAIDGFHTAYYLKVVAGAGFLLKVAPEPWRVFVPTANGFRVVMEADDRPKMPEVEAAIRVATMKQRG